MTGLRFYDRRATLLPLSAALLAPIVLNACAKKQERQARPPATVTVAVARRASVPYVIEANGVVTPAQSVAVTPQVDGIITGVDFQEGQEVRVGQPLFHIDARPYQNAYNQAVAVYVRDSSSWANAKSNADRYKQLMSAKVITPLEGEAQLTTAATSEATVNADRALVEQAKFNLDNAIVRAPISGKTGGLLVRQGNVVRSGGVTPLVVINQVRPIYVRFAIPSSQLPIVLQYGAQGGLPVAAVPGGVAPPSPSIDSLAAAAMAEVDDAAGQSANGAAATGGAGGGADANGAGNGGRRRGRNGGGANGGASADPSSAGSTAGGPNAGAPNGGGSPRGRNGGGANAAEGGNANGANSANPANGAQPMQQGAPAGERLMGKLSFIDNAVDTSTGTVQLKATFDNSSGRLWSGQFATTSLHLFDEENALVVPTQAVVTGQRGAYVYVVDQADTARQRAVVVERAAGGLTIISSGIHEGDRVVTDGQARLTPDSPVRLRGATDNFGGAQGGGRRGRRGGNAGGNGGNTGANSGSTGAASGGASPGTNAGAGGGQTQSGTGRRGG
jgi:multidrug efflux system membrane fusion protein